MSSKNRRVGLYPCQISTLFFHLLKFYDKSCNFESFHQPNNHRALHQKYYLEIQKHSPRCKLFLKSSQISQESTVIGVSFLIKLQAWDLQIKWKRSHRCFLRHMCFPLIVVKVLRTPRFLKYFRWLLLEVFMLSISLYFGEASILFTFNA